MGQPVSRGSHRAGSRRCVGLPRRERRAPLRSGRRGQCPGRCREGRARGIRSARVDARTTRETDAERDNGEGSDDGGATVTLPTRRRHGPPGDSRMLRRYRPMAWSIPHSRTSCSSSRSALLTATPFQPGSQHLPQLQDRRAHSEQQSTSHGYQSDRESRGFILSAEAGDETKGPRPIPDEAPTSAVFNSARQRPDGGDGGN